MKGGGPFSQVVDLIDRVSLLFLRFIILGPGAAFEDLPSRSPQFTTMRVVSFPHSAHGRSLYGLV